MFTAQEIETAERSVLSADCELGKRSAMRCVSLVIDITKCPLALILTENVLWIMKSYTYDK